MIHTVLVMVMILKITVRHDDPAYGPGDGDDEIP